MLSRLALLAVIAAADERPRLYSLKEVNEQTFEKEVLRSDVDVLLHVFNPASDLDFKIQPRVTALANKLRYVDGLTFMKFDVSKTSFDKVVSDKTMKILKQTSMADYSDPESKHPRILLFSTYAKDEPAVFNEPDINSVSVETIVNFLADNKLWSDEELKAVEKGFGRPLNQIIVQPVNPLSADDNIFDVIDSNKNSKIDITELAAWLELPFGSEKLQIMFDADDQDKDGYISWTEFSGPKGTGDTLSYDEL